MRWEKFCFILFIKFSIKFELVKTENMFLFNFDSRAYVTIYMQT